MATAQTDFEFSDFPRSYRLAQQSIGAAFLVLLLGRKAMGPAMPQGIRMVFIGIVAALVLASLVLSNYVVIRYPWLSLVEPRDGDSFDKTFSSAGKRILRVLSWMLILAIGSLLWILASKGALKLGAAISFVYLLSLLVILLFMALRYDPVRHPTLATLLRSTLGLGIPLFVLFIPALILGSQRCSRLLDQFEGPAGLPAGPQAAMPLPNSLDRGK